MVTYHVDPADTVPGYAKITGLEHLAPATALYLEREPPFSARITTALLGERHDVFAPPHLQRGWLERVAPDLREPRSPPPAATAEMALEALYRRPDFFGGAPCAAPVETRSSGKRSVVQLLAQGTLDWARGGPFGVALEVGPGAWIAHTLTYGFARTFSMPQHRERLGAPVGDEVTCAGDEDPVHPYPGSYQRFDGAVLHWDRETNRVWYQTWDGQIHEK